VSEALEESRDDVSCAGEERCPCITGGQSMDGRGNLPLLALILDFIAQVEDDLPVLAGQSLICRFHFFS
jgi:hypothetical protein